MLSYNLQSIKSKITSQKKIKKQELEYIKRGDFTELFNYIQDIKNPDKNTQYNIDIILKEISKTTSIFHDAAAEGNTKVVELFLNAKADPNTIKNGTTPLTLATENNHTDTAKLLLMNKARPNVTTITTPLDSAKKNDNETLIDLFSSHGAKTASDLNLPQNKSFKERLNDSIDRMIQPIESKNYNELMVVSISITALAMISFAAVLSPVVAAPIIMPIVAICAVCTLGLCVMAGINAYKETNNPSSSITAAVAQQQNAAALEK